MNRIPVFMMAATLAGASVHALADDSPADQPVMSLKQKMQDCMAKQRAANTGMSDKDMRTACRNQIKAERDHPSVPASPNNVPPSSPQS